jgi:hypothetical protein
VLSGKRIKLKDRLFNTFIRSKDAAIDILIIKGRLELIKDYERFKRIWNKGLLCSEDIISISDIKTGPILGAIIVELKKAQFEGRVKSRKAAIKFIRNLNIKNVK